MEHYRNNSKQSLSEQDRGGYHLTSTFDENRELLERESKIRNMMLANFALSNIVVKLRSTKIKQMII